MTTRPVYKAIAGRLAAVRNCDKSGNAEWSLRHQEEIYRLVKHHLPSGSGFDLGTILEESSTPEKLIFTTSFHHMNEHGYYDGWTRHSIVITPSLACDFNTKVTGRDRQGIKDYIAEVFSELLSQPASNEEQPTKAVG